MGRFVVSANYRDRSSAQRWLVREVHETAAMARPQSALIATGVQFQESGVVEMGFGCSMVAYCTSVDLLTEANPHTDARPLQFDGIKFVNEQSEEVTECFRLILRSNGTMWHVRASDEVVATEMAAPTRQSDATRQAVSA